MSKYRRPAHSIIDEPKFFLKHWWHEFLLWCKENTDQLLTGLIAILVIGAAAVLWQRHRYNTDLAGWQSLDVIANADQLEAAVMDYSGTSAGLYLNLALADANLKEGRPQEADEYYRQVASEATGEIALRAKFGLARALEAQGEFELAGKAYEEIVSDDGFWGEKARESIEELPRLAEFHARLETAKEEYERKTAEDAAAAASELDATTLEATASSLEAEGDAEGDGEGAADAEDLSSQVPVITAPADAASADAASADAAAPTTREDTSAAADGGDD